MNILKIIRYAFSPNSYSEDDRDDFLKSKELIEDENIQNKILYRINENEKLELENSRQKRIDKLADKHWNKFKKELNISKTSSNADLLLYRIAATFLFILNPWLIYQSIERAFRSQDAFKDPMNVFFFTVESVENWKNISIEFSLFTIILPFIVFLFVFLLNWKKQISLFYYFLISFSVFLSWGYYVLTQSDSVIPIFTSSCIAIFGILLFLVSNKSRK